MKTVTRLTELSQFFGLSSAGNSRMEEGLSASVEHQRELDKKSASMPSSRVSC